MPGRFTPLSRLILTAALIPGTSAALAQPADVMAVRAGRIITLVGPSIDNGVILVKNGKIVAIGPVAKIKIPAGARIVDARAKTVMPGLIAAYSTLAGSSE